MYYLSRLRDLRQDRDLKQKEIAALLKIDQRVYSTYETGKREIPLRHLVFLAQYYHTSTDYLLGLTNEEKPYPAIKTNHRARAQAREPFLVLFWRAKENFSFSLPPAQYSAVPHPTATRRECVPPAPDFSGGCGPASRGLPMSGR